MESQERTAEDQMKLVKRHSRLGWLNFAAIITSAYFGVCQMGNYMLPASRANASAYSDPIKAKNSAYVQLSHELDVMEGRTRATLSQLHPNVTNEVIGTKTSILTNNTERVNIQKLALIEQYANQVDEDYSLFLGQNSNHLAQVQSEREEVYQQTLEDVAKDKVADWFKLGGSLTILGAGIAERRRTLRRMLE